VNPDDGSAAKDNPFINNANPAMHKYYAYGIRNSFGITFDPLTGNLWQIENRPDVYDEINIVKPSFNSGWIQIMGPLSRNVGVTTSQLVNYPCSYYANPVFSWILRGKLWQEFTIQMIQMIAKIGHFSITVSMLVCVMDKRYFPSLRHI
jgi:hypothetical protein